MPYMLLMIEPPGQRRTRTQAEGRELHARMLRFGEGLRERGLLVAAESLASQAGAARLQSRGGQVQVLDGPFAEAKEMVGGFFLVDCSTREEAIRIARECPAVEWGTVEVRAVAPCYDDASDAAAIGAPSRV